MTPDTTRQWILADRPTDQPTEEDFELVESDVEAPGPREVLVRTRYMSLDPYMRGRMRGTNSYGKSWTVGESMRARCVGEVVESNCEGLDRGEFVLGNLYWSEYATVDGRELERIKPMDLPLSTALHVLGMSGRTAYLGTVEVGRVKPGDTVVISAAGGAVGSIAGQIAQIAGGRIVGITGAEEKVTWLTEDLGFDNAINYRDADDLPAAIEEACPSGVDLYFENVGGEVSDAVLDHLTQYSRVAVCGKIALYNSEDSSDQPQGPRRMYQRTRTRVEGFVVGDYEHQFNEIDCRLRRWVRGDELRYRETITTGIERAPEAFLGLFEGINIGKQIVAIPEDTHAL